MKNWYDGLTDQEIQQLKDNEKPLGLCPEWMQEAFRKIALKGEPSRDLQYYLDGWIPYGTGNLTAYTYRLDPNWQRPEAKKEARWEYFNVEKGCGDYARWEVTFSKKDWRGPVTITLMGAMGVVGFGGIEFEERPNEWCMHLLHVVQSFGGSSSWTISVHASADSKPATPKRIRVRRQG